MNKFAYLFGALIITGGFTSCKKPNDGTPLPPASTCRPTRFVEYENTDPNNPNQATVYLDRSFVYNGDKLVRIDTKKRGVTDGHREIKYSGDLPVQETYYDKDNNVTYDYKFNYEPGSKRIASTDIEFHIVTPFVQARYENYYDAQNRVDSVAVFYSGRRTGYTLYTFENTPDGEKVTASLYQVSSSDPTWKEKYAIAEYTYDKKRQ